MNSLIFGSFWISLFLALMDFMDFLGFLGSDWIRGLWGYFAYFGFLGFLVYFGFHGFHGFLDFLDVLRLLTLLTTHIYSTSVFKNDLFIAAMYIHQISVSPTFRTEISVLEVGKMNDLTVITSFGNFETNKRWHCCDLKLKKLKWDLKNTSIVFLFRLPILI